MVRVKVCGLTNLDDSLAAAGFGADALGFVFAPSPRRIEPDKARGIVLGLPPFVLRVGVFVDAPVEWIEEVRRHCELDVVQLHGSESEDFVSCLGGRIIKGLRVGGETPLPERAYAGATLLLDTYEPGRAGGTGRTFDWSLAVEPARQRPVILAGGLTPDNVSQAVQTVSPYAVDVSSGVESEPGRKDHEKLECFIRRAKSAAGPA
ncbi:MAG: phosphoribosylanthranilate isomerase [Proteobacteria bacterium]|nr:phosphoribosylanthranilate isomerase [Pseudomonadota bacterium]